MSLMDVMDLSKRVVDKYKRQINTFDSIKDWKHLNVLLPTHTKLQISLKSMHELYTN